MSRSIEANNYATAALGYFRLGDKEKAHELLEKARQLDAYKAVLGHVEQAIAAGNGFSE